MEKSKTYIATPPGATIKEQLLDRAMSQKDFACRMDMSEKHISHLINGEVQLTPEVALKLEMVLGIPAKFWNNLEAIYREKLTLVREEKEMDEDLKQVKFYPFKEMVKNKWIENVKSNEGKVFALRKYFEVVNLSLLKDYKITRIACRRQDISEKANYALTAWAQRAKIEARKINTKKINLQKLEKSLQKIRAMTNVKPEIFCKQLIDLLSECGIAIVFLPHIRGSFLHGATFLDNKKIVIGLTVRGKDADKFWFSLFHEIAHILKGHIFNDQYILDKDEKDADAFAKETLIPEKLFEKYASQGCFTTTSLKKAAKYFGIDEGILIGRLQKEGYIKYNQFNELKTKYLIRK